MRMRRVISVIGFTVVSLFATVAVSGTLLFANASSDPVRKVDAVVVLGGEHDGREKYGLSLVRAGIAPVLVLSNPYPADDKLMRRMCKPREREFEILCKKPIPATTRGEALLVRELAAE